MHRPKLISTDLKLVVSIPSLTLQISSRECFLHLVPAIRPSLVWADALPSTSTDISLLLEANFFPEAHLLNEEFGQKMQGFIGLKGGVRKKKVGVFAKARPGVMWFGEFQTRGSCTSILIGTSCTVGHEKDFAMDLGGVFEFYPAE